MPTNVIVFRLNDAPMYVLIKPLIGICANSNKIHMEGGVMEIENPN